MHTLKSKMHSAKLIAEMERKIHPGKYPINNIPTKM